MPFPYFGRKARIAHLYPHARYDTIVEPFAGSAGYALHADHWMRDVVLVERDPDIAGLWRWLIDPATTDETIMGLPDISEGDRIADIFDPTHPGHTLLQLASASNQSLHVRTVTERMQRAWPGMRRRIARDIRKVKHWAIIEGDYTDAPDVDATWFIDPPYQRIVLGYRTDRATIGFDALATWCRTRRGQVIVCEESTADWLPFTPLTTRNTVTGGLTTEVWWTNEPGTLW